MMVIQCILFFICRLDGIDTPELCPKNNNILEKLQELNQEII
jgi:hypothetical protein